MNNVVCGTIIVHILSLTKKFKFMENPIGRKVNLLVKKGDYVWEMSNNICEVIGVVPWSHELNDWCQHYIVKSQDGTEKEIREVECVFSPNYDKDYIEDTIHQFLDDNGVWCEVYTQMGRKVISVHIDWGDWSHSHRWCVTLMGYLGYTEIGNRVTEEDGSDCYSAEHYFLKES